MPPTIERFEGSKSLGLDRRVYLITNSRVTTFVYPDFTSPLLEELKDEAAIQKLIKNVTEMVKNLRNEAAMKDAADKLHMTTEALQEKLDAGEKFTY